MAWHCAPRTVKLMLKAGADIGKRTTEDGDNAFLLSCATGDPKTAKILLEAGCNINEVSNKKSNGLMYTALNGNIDMIEFLVKNGIDINAQNEKGQTALYFAISKEVSMFTTTIQKEQIFENQLDTIKELLKHGADINIKDKFGNTPLTHAVYRGNIDITKLLLENGADINAPIKNILLTVNDIPHMVSVDKDEMIALLNSHGAELKSFYARYKINVNCTECGKLIPLNGPFQKLKCDYCLSINNLDDKFWPDIFESSYSEYSLDDTYNVEFELSNPSCSECDTELVLPDVFDQSHSEIICSKCGHANASFPVPEWFKAYTKNELPPQQIICGESEQLISKQSKKEVNPIALRCISCSAALSITVDTERNCKCEHCGIVQYLPDPVWKALHPVKKRKVWYIRFSKI